VAQNLKYTEYVNAATMLTGSGTLPSIFLKYILFKHLKLDEC